MNLSATEITALITSATAAIVGLKAVWNFFKRVYAIFNQVETYGPVLMNIAEQFKKNGGNSLKDQLDRVEKMAGDAATVSVDARRISQKNHESIVRIDERTRNFVDLTKAAVSPPPLPQLTPATV